MKQKEFERAVSKVLAIKPKLNSVLSTNLGLVDRVAKAIWESNSEHKEFALPIFEKLEPPEQEEWREAARAALIEIFKP